MQAMVTQDREAFYAHELAVREQGGLPPFGRLAALIVSANEHEAAMGFARRLLGAAPRAEGLRLFGPADAPVAVVGAATACGCWCKAPGISTSPAMSASGSAPPNARAAISGFRSTSTR